jgi:hypothetical protein
VHGLEQRQQPPPSKESFQVPDFLAIVQPADLHGESALLVETKLVSGQKVTLEIQQDQLDLVGRYANALGLPLLVGVFWEKLRMWTTHTPDQMVHHAKTARIDLDTALRKDLSIVFSDSVMTIGQHWRRRTTYDPNATGFHLRDPHRGYIVEDHLATDGKHFVKLTEVESGIMSKLAPFKVIETTRAHGRRIVMAESQTERATKLSSVLHLLLEDFEAFGDDTQPKVAFDTFTEFKIRASLPTHPGLPDEPTPQVTALFERVFGFTWSAGDRPTG